MANRKLEYVPSLSLDPGFVNGGNVPIPDLSSTGQLPEISAWSEDPQDSLLCFQRTNSGPKTVRSYKHKGARSFASDSRRSDGGSGELVTLNEPGQQTPESSLITSESSELSSDLLEAPGLRLGEDVLRGAVSGFVTTAIAPVLHKVLPQAEGNIMQNLLAEGAALMVASKVQPAIVEGASKLFPALKKSLPCPPILGSVLMMAGFTLGRMAGNFFSGLFQQEQQNRAPLPSAAFVQQSATGCGYVDNSPAGECVICLDNRQDVLITPCGHVAFCHVCHEAQGGQLAACPICREAILQCFRIRYP